MEYSEWQLTRLRNALRAFHKHGRHEVGDEDDRKRSRERKLNWKYVAEEIWDAAGPSFLGLMDDRDTDVRRKRIKQFAERLRQFVEGNRNPDGVEKRKFQRMQADSLAAIVKFVTAADLLQPDELEEHAPSTQAALRLLEYLDQGFDRIRTLPLLKFDGTYQARRKNHDDNEFIVLELTLERPSHDGMMQVTMTEEVFDAKLEDKFDRWKPQERHECRNTLIHYGGWAIFTPEENVMLFLKGPSQKNLYQFTLAADLEYRPEDPVQKLVLQHHHYPIELEDRNQDEPEMIQGVLQETAKYLVVFKRIA
jgi:hypothetical protein